jgi:hypothetical protein
MILDLFRKEVEFNNIHGYDAVWKNQGDIRDVISIGKLVRKKDGPYEIEQIMNTMVKYGETPSRKSGGE